MNDSNGVNIPLPLTRAFLCFKASCKAPARPPCGPLAELEAAAVDSAALPGTMAALLSFLSESLTFLSPPPP